MKIHKTLPRDEQFFGYYARLIPTLFKVGILSQVFSALIETYILYSILRPKFQGVTSSPETAALLGALLLVALLEIGLRTTAAFSVRAVLYRKFRGLDLPMTVFIWALAGSLLVCSLTLHIEGAREAVEANSQAPQLEETAHIETSGQAEAVALLRAFSQDSGAIAATYAARIKSTRAETAAKERAYLTRRGATSAGAAEIRAKGEAKVAGLEAERGAKIERALERKDGRLERIKTRQFSAADEINSRNKNRLERAENRLSKYSSYLSVFSVLTVLFFLLTIALNEVHKRGSGIEEVAIASQYHFEQPVFAKLTTAVNDKFQYHARRAIDRLEDSIPAPRAPLAPHPLFDWGGLMPERVAMQTRERRYANSPAGDERKQPPAINGKHNDRAAQTGVEPPADDDGGLFVATKRTPPTPAGSGGSANRAPAGSMAAAILGSDGSANTREYFYFVDKDRAHFTIEHKGRHYTMRDINSFVTTYERRAAEARKRGNDTALKSREEALQYWKGRREELLRKMQASG